MESLQLYEKIVKIGEGSGGKIILCKNNNQQQDKENQNQNTQNSQQNKYVVAKRFITQGRPTEFKEPTDIIEVKFMTTLDHPNIAKALDIHITKKVYSGGTQFNYLNVIMDFYLELVDYTALNCPNMAYKGVLFQDFSIDDKKCLMKQILTGVKYLHDKNIIHRDIKPSNLLLDRSGVLKIGDMGISHQKTDEDEELSYCVVTRQYRAPELLYGKKNYGTEIDMWSVGVTFAEIAMGGKRLFDSNGDFLQLQKIFEVMGCANETNWPGVSNLPNFIEFENMDPVPLTQIITQQMFPVEGVNIISQLLSLDPSKRPTAEQCLESEFFKNTPSLQETNIPKIADTLLTKKLEICLSKQKNKK